MKRILVVLAVAMQSLMGLAAAADYPERAVRLVVPSPPGGTLDFLARPLAASMSRELQVPVVVDNRGGAGGSVGAEAVARSAPDGYTVMLADGSALAINTSLNPHLTFDVLHDFTPISLVAQFPFLLLATPSFAATNLADLVVLAKQKPDSINYASPGVGTPQHLGGAMLSSMAGIRMTHIAYRGGGPVLTDLLGGQVPIAFVGVPPAIPYVKAGKLRALAVSSAQRSPLFPDVPTIAESGYPDFEASIWFGFFAPAGVPPAITAKLVLAVQAGLADPEVQSKMREQGVEIIAANPSRLDAYMRSEIAKWRVLVKATGATAQ